MPDERSIKLESIAWATVDKYCMDNPKPKLDTRTKHRCKVWVNTQILNRVILEQVQNDFVLPLSERDKREMLDYAERTIDN